MILKACLNTNCDFINLQYCWWKTSDLNEVWKIKTSLKSFCFLTKDSVTFINYWSESKLSITTIRLWGEKQGDISAICLASIFRCFCHKDAVENSECGTSWELKQCCYKMAGNITTNLKVQGSPRSRSKTTIREAVLHYVCFSSNEMKS